MLLSPCSKKGSIYVISADKGYLFRENSRNLADTLFEKEIVQMLAKDSRVNGTQSYKNFKNL